MTERQRLHIIKLAELRRGQKCPWINKDRRHSEDTKLKIGLSNKGKLKGKKRNAINNDCDLFALVCLDTMKIGYVTGSEMPSTINIRADELRGTYYDEDGIATYYKAIELRKEGLDNRNIALRLGKNESVISRYLQNGFIPFETKARYFSDFIRTKEWFYEL